MEAPIPVSTLPHTTATSSTQQVIYHVYQVQAPTNGRNFTVAGGNCNPIAWIRPILLFFQWALWVVYLAGAALIQNDCNNSAMPILPFGSFTVGNLPPDGVAACTQYFSLLWWSVFLQFFVIIGATFILIAILTHLDDYTSTVMYFHVMSSVLMFFIAYYFVNSLWIIENNQVFYTHQSSPISVSSTYSNACYLISAGSIGNLICNFLYIILMDGKSEFLKTPHLGVTHQEVDAHATVTDAHAKPVVIHVPAATETPAPAAVGADAAASVTVTTA
ncbi:hypothetical protein CEUSTIGMA_g13072.t1 [Chlamydomonas eustigma]|uniref:Uncharacterized protein n=1 Tax=Chlamydomonas eustigma TaxID=1157962 RepID=A0A250XRF5_9CHLO|nr:hypothetical protein CEUSTIGMA_g13072.t1 [Chlamydomonas eustigma]|eukprot:GAX85657.1 hypothetical protein CEUSTIGMA_g13072.t1 [Chlamydomonas eustigma]